MFNLTYSSNEDKRALEKLQDRLNRATDPVIRRQTLLDIQEIEAKAKPYQLCDLIEADELRSQILNKISLLTRIGKTAEPFLVHLKDVEFHIQTSQMREATKETERLVRDSTIEKEGTVKPVKAAEKEKRRKEAFGATRWKIGFEDEPDDNQNGK